MLKQDPASDLRDGIPVGTNSEFLFWRARADDLTSLYEQLMSEKVKKVLRILETTKSTYHQPFHRITKDVSVALTEAVDVSRYISPLSKELRGFSALAFPDLMFLFKPVLIDTIVLLRAIVVLLCEKETVAKHLFCRIRKCSKIR